MIWQMSVMIGVRSDGIQKISSTEGVTSAVFLGLDSSAWDRVLISALVAMFVATMVMGLAVAGSTISQRREAALRPQIPDQRETTMAGRVDEAQAEASMTDGASRQKPVQPVQASPTAEAPPAQEAQPQSGKSQPSLQEVTPAESRKSLRNAAISAEAERILTRELRAHPGNVSVDYDGVDIQTQPLGVQLQHAFSDAGWNVSSGIMLGISIPPQSGILIRGNSSGLTTTQEKAIRAFTIAGIPFDLRLDREPRSYISGQAHTPFGMGSDDVEIVVTLPRPAGHR